MPLHETGSFIFRFFRPHPSFPVVLMNAEWHRKNKMPPNATLEQKAEWHREHAERCACREMPERIRKELAKRR